jgi:acetylornithine deacetylase/succinyl-diaminopimelate desuccinylase-like protein
MSAAEILEGIRAWVEIESHTADLAGVQAMVAELEDLTTGGCSDGNFTAPIAPTLDGLGVDGEGGDSDHEQLYISSLEPRAELLYRLLATLE